MAPHFLLTYLLVVECGHGWIAKFAYSPWPECLQRKLQIGKRIPKDQLAMGIETTSD